MNINLRPGTFSGLIAHLAGWVRGSIIRGGAAAWEVYNAATNHFILVGNGTDINSIAFDWDDMAAGAGADMVHNHSTNVEGGSDVILLVQVFS